MKFFICGVLISAVALLCVQADDDKKDEIKVYKRLIPADVLRGEFNCFVRLKLLRELKGSN